MATVQHSYTLSNPDEFSTHPEKIYMAWNCKGLAIISAYKYSTVWPPTVIYNYATTAAYLQLNQSTNFSALLTDYTQYYTLSSCYCDSWFESADGRQASSITTNTKSSALQQRAPGVFSSWPSSMTYATISVSNVNAFPIRVAISFTPYGNPIETLDLGAYNAGMQSDGVIISTGTSTTNDCIGTFSERYFAGTYYVWAIGVKRTIEEINRTITIVENSPCESVVVTRSIAGPVFTAKTPTSVSIKNSNASWVWCDVKNAEIAGNQYIYTKKLSANTTALIQGLSADDYYKISFSRPDALPLTKLFRTKQQTPILPCTATTTSLTFTNNNSYNITVTQGATAKDADASGGYCTFTGLSAATGYFFGFDGPNSIDYSQSTATKYTSFSKPTVTTKTSTSLTVKNNDTTAGTLYYYKTASGASSKSSVSIGASATVTLSNLSSSTNYTMYIQSSSCPASVTEAATTNTGDLTVSLVTRTASSLKLRTTAGASVTLDTTTTKTADSSGYVTFTGLNADNTYPISATLSDYTAWTGSFTTLKTLAVPVTKASTLMAAFEVTNPIFNEVTVNYQVLQGSTVITTSTLDPGETDTITSVNYDTTYTVIFTAITPGYESSSATCTTLKQMSKPTISSIDLTTAIITNPSGNPTVTVSTNKGTLDDSSLTAGTPTTIRGLSQGATFIITFTASGYCNTINSAKTLKELSAVSFSNITTYSFRVTNPSGNPTVTMTCNGVAQSVTAGSYADFTGLSMNTSYTVTVASSGYKTIKPSQKTLKGTMSSASLTALSSSSIRVTNPSGNPTVDVYYNSTNSATTSTKVKSDLAAGGTYDITGLNMNTTYYVWLTNSNYDTPTVSYATTSKGSLSAPSCSHTSWSNYTLPVYTVTNNNSVTVNVTKSTGTLYNSSGSLVTSLSAGASCYWGGSANTSVTITFSATNYNSNTTTFTSAALSSMSAPALENNGCYSLKITNPSGNPTVAVSTSAGTLELTKLAAGGSTYVNGLGMNSSCTVYFKSNGYSGTYTQKSTLKGDIIAPTFTNITYDGFTINNASTNPKVSVSTSGGNLSATTIDPGSSCALTGCSANSYYTITFSATNYNSNYAQQKTAKTPLMPPLISNITANGFTVANKNLVTVSATCTGTGTTIKSLAAKTGTWNITGLSPNANYKVTFSATNYESASESATTLKGTMSSASLTALSSSSIRVTNPSGNPTVDVYYNSTNSATTSTKVKSDLAAGGTYDITGLNMNTTYYVWLTNSNYDTPTVSSKATNKGTMNAPSISSLTGWYYYTTPYYTVTNTNSFLVTVSLTSSGASIYNGDGSTCTSIAAGGKAYLYVTNGVQATVTFSATNYNNSSNSVTGASVSYMSSAPRLSATGYSTIYITNPSGNPSVDVYYGTENNVWSSTLCKSGLAAGSSYNLGGLSSGTTYYVFFCSNGYWAKQDSTSTWTPTPALPALDINWTSDSQSITFYITDPTGTIPAGTPINYFIFIPDEGDAVDGVINMEESSSVYIGYSDTDCECTFTVDGYDGSAFVDARTQASSTS